MYLINKKYISYDQLMDELSKCEILKWTSNHHNLTQCFCLLRTHNDMAERFYSKSHAELHLDIFRRNKKFHIQCSIFSIDDKSIVLEGPIETYKEVIKRRNKFIEIIESWNGQVPTLLQVEDAIKQAEVYWDR